MLTHAVLSELDCSVLKRHSFSLFPADIHNVVGDEALWRRHPPVGLLRLSPGVDAVAKTTGCASSPTARKALDNVLS